MEDLDRVDWSKIDLSEWTAILTLTGLNPGAPENLNMDKLTGSESLLNEADKENERQDVKERTLERTQGTDMEEVTNDVAEGLWDEL